MQTIAQDRPALRQICEGGAQGQPVLPDLGHAEFAAQRSSRRFPGGDETEIDAGMEPGRVHGDEVGDDSDEGDVETEAAQCAQGDVLGKRVH